jgi:hypothetical protein
MKQAWMRARPYVWSFGGHAVLIGLLVFGWSRHPSMPASHGSAPSESIRAIDASLVAAPVAAPEKPPEPPKAVPAQAKASAQAEPQPARAEAPSVSVPSPHVATDIADSTDPRDVDRPRESPTGQPLDAVAQTAPSTSPSDAVRSAPTLPTSPALAPASDTPTPSESPDDDPYAEMRRQRAEAELRYQLSVMATRGGTAREPGARANPAANAEDNRPLATASVAFPGAPGVLSLDDFRQATGNTFASHARCPAHRFGDATTGSIDCTIDEATAHWYAEVLHEAGIWNPYPTSDTAWPGVTGRP